MDRSCLLVSASSGRHAGISVILVSVGETAAVEVDFARRSRLFPLNGGGAETTEAYDASDT